ncbi:MAG: uracil-DNA glycosylase [Proteobacteria bacterium]|nr:uracil-DNA glycosylase [Pseudomonadota bacterium]
MKNILYNKNLLSWYISIGVDNFLYRTPTNHLRNQTKILDSKNTLASQKKEVTHLFKEKTQHIATSMKTIHEINEFLTYKFNECDLKKYAQKTVVYDGNINADIMLIGEAPGATEDAQGIPFCGQSGKLLDAAVNSIGLYREKNIFITNTVFWRPPQNRRPTSLEIEICKPFLQKIIHIINPSLIILVGSTAAESLLDIKGIPMSELRKRYFKYTNQFLQNHSIDSAVIFHPSYLLRRSTEKKQMWLDLLSIKDKFIDNKIHI